VTVGAFAEWLGASALVVDLPAVEVLHRRFWFGLGQILSDDIGNLAGGLRRLDGV
jgi:hypothetical protein